MLKSIEKLTLTGKTSIFLQLKSKLGPHFKQNQATSGI